MSSVSEVEPIPFPFVLSTVTVCEVVLTEIEYVCFQAASNRIPS